MFNLFKKKPSVSVIPDQVVKTGIEVTKKDTSVVKSSEFDRHEIQENKNIIQDTYNRSPKHSPNSDKLKKELIDSQGVSKKNSTLLGYSSPVRAPISSRKSKAKIIIQNSQKKAFDNIQSSQQSPIANTQTSLKASPNVSTNRRRASIIADNSLGLLSLNKAEQQTTTQEPKDSSKSHSLSMQSKATEECVADANDLKNSTGKSNLLGYAEERNVSSSTDHSSSSTKSTTKAKIIIPASHNPNTANLRTSLKPSSSFQNKNTLLGFANEIQSRKDSSLTNSSFQTTLLGFANEGPSYKDSSSSNPSSNLTEKVEKDNHNKYSVDDAKKLLSYYNNGGKGSIGISSVVPEATKILTEDTNHQTVSTIETSNIASNLEALKLSNSSQEDNDHTSPSVHRKIKQVGSSSGSKIGLKKDIEVRTSSGTKIGLSSIQPEFKPENVIVLDINSRSIETQIASSGSTNAEHFGKEKLSSINSSISSSITNSPPLINNSQNSSTTNSPPLNNRKAIIVSISPKSSKDPSPLTLPKQGLNEQNNNIGRPLKKIIEPPLSETFVRRKLETIQVPEPPASVNFSKVHVKVESASTSVTPMYSPTNESGNVDARHVRHSSVPEPIEISNQQIQVSPSQTRQKAKILIKEQNSPTVSAKQEYVDQDKRDLRPSSEKHRLRRISAAVDTQSNVETQTLNRQFKTRTNALKNSETSLSPTKSAIKTSTSSRVSISSLTIRRSVSFSQEVVMSKYEVEDEEEI